jgi:uncharacterized protein involved in outer membrane biogenesis
VAVAASLMMNDALKRGIVTVGPRFTKTTVTLDSAKLSLFSGAGTITGLVIGNPRGYKAPSAISIGSLRLGLEPASLLSDKIVVTGLLIDSPQVTLETDLRHNNLQQILDNLDSATASGTNATQTTSDNKGANRKLEVDDLLISGGRINLIVTGVADQSATAVLKQIHLTNLGTGPDGITTAELAKVVLRAIEQSAVQSGSGAISDIKNGAMYFSKDPVKGGSNTVDKAAESVDELFKKK